MPNLDDIVIEKKRYNLMQRRSRPHFGLVHAFYAGMGGFAFYGPNGDEPLNVEESLFEISTNPRYTVEVADPETVIYIVRSFPHLITDITEDSILDRAESSSLSKAILIFQVGWFCTNCASRLNQGLPLSLLEVSTAAHAFCTLLTYFVWWSKPSNVATPTIMREKGAREVYALLKCSDIEYSKALEMAGEGGVRDSSTLTGTHASEKITLAANALRRLPPGARKPPKFQPLKRLIWSAPGYMKAGSKGFSGAVTTALCPVLYGAIHFLAWGDKFPKTQHAQLWRVSSAVVTSSGFLGVIALTCLHKVDKQSLVHIFVVSVVSLIISVHIVGSGCLIVLSFYQLFFLDPAAYQLSSWSNYWPHFSWMYALCAGTFLPPCSLNLYESHPLVLLGLEFAAYGQYISYRRVFLRNKYLGEHNSSTLQVASVVKRSKGGGRGFHFLGCPFCDYRGIDQSLFVVKLAALC